MDTDFNQDHSVASWHLVQYPSRQASVQLQAALAARCSRSSTGQLQVWRTPEIWSEPALALPLLPSLPLLLP